VINPVEQTGVQDNACIPEISTPFRGSVIMEEKGLVSVIIPTFNRPTFLPQAIESVLGQTYPNIEIIVVDDGSENEGEKTLDALKPYLSRLTYVYQENQGIGAAVNKGLSLAKGEFIQRLDDDDMLAKEKIEKCVEVFQRNHNVGLVATGYYVIDESGNQIRTLMPLHYPRKATFFFMLMAIISAQAAVMVRRSCHDVVGLYRTDIMSEDYEMWLRIARKYEIATIDEPLTFYRRHNDNITKLKNAGRFEKDIIQFVKYYLEKPIEELIPNIKSEAYGYTLKAIVYISQDGIQVRTTDLAQEELDKALALAPHDPLINLWKLVLEIHKGDYSVQEKDLSNFGKYEGSAMALIKLKEELQTLKASHLPPSSPEMTEFRGRYGRLNRELISETYRRATKDETVSIHHVRGELSSDRTSSRI
jgi:glycosyltransferase involved in cell wall biosynthesis